VTSIMLLTYDELLELTDDNIIRYILELTGYNDIIYEVNRALEE